jgi:glycosyltransferase involved in cell wall biosynthesis
VRILFLALTGPLPANNGYTLRNWALLRALAAEEHEVTLLAFGDRTLVRAADQALLEGVCRGVDLIPFTWSQLSSLRDIPRRLRGLPGPRPYSVQRFQSSAMRTRVVAHIEGEKIEAVVSDVFTAINLPTVSPPILLNHHNTEHVILRRYLAQERHPAKLAYASLEYWKMKRWERDLCRVSAVGMVCSESDRVTLGRLAPSLRLEIVPNVVDVASADTSVPEHPRTVLFQGGLDWYPNRDAVTFLATAILPELRRRIPDACVVIAGRNPDPRFIRRFRDIPDFRFTGTVDDMRPMIARAAVCVAPLRIGSGTRLKILEAAALAKPIVSTTLGAEGLDFRDGEEILLADEPAAFAEAVAGLLRDNRRRTVLGRAARRRVEAQYTVTTLRHRLRQALSQATRTS